MTKKRTFLRDVNSLMKTVANVTADQVTISTESLESADEGNDIHEGSIIAEVAPSSGAYKGGKFKFEIYAVSEYPESPPEVRCLTEIYHPNIDSDDTDSDGTNICVSLLEQGEWDPNMTLEHCIQAILFLFYNPNWEDALSPLFSPDLTETDFEKNVKISIEGGDIEGRLFERNYGFTVSENVTNDADGSKLTDQEIELNSINTALNNARVDNNETVEINRAEDSTTEIGTRVEIEESQEENTVQACDTAQVNIEIPTVDFTTQEVDPTTQEVDLQETVRQEVDQTETNTVVPQDLECETQTSGHVDSEEVIVSENNFNTDQRETIKSFNILSAIILDYSTIQNLKVDKQAGFLHRSLSVGDSPRGEISKLNNVAVGVDKETENKLGIRTNTLNVCDIGTNAIDGVADAGVPCPFVVDEQQQLLPDSPTNTKSGKGMGASTEWCCNVM
ncbi:uncharacterized protein LOC117328983 [Pecten maximus]|uniref:uncharacterized protein LOC117328983 n=1 Tax=Pecten maximus TaxID=6579 RepID=UPI001458F607|nr:uncharacterized protein LOC117328983 [Pecten maximus]